MARVEGKAKPPKYKSVGPYLAAALIAEKVLVEPDGAATIVRIVDSVVLPPAAADRALDSMLALHNMFLVIAFRAGGIKAKSTATVVMVGPSGKSGLIGNSEMKFDGTDDRTYNIQAPVALRWDGKGLYFFDILLDGKFMSRVPLQVYVGDFPEKKEKKRP